MIKGKRMFLMWLVFCLCAMPVLTGTEKGNRKCPAQCECEMDELNRYQAICAKGGLISFPAHDLDPDVEIIIIRGARSPITIGPLFRQFLKLKVLRITESGVPAIGSESFWGLKYLRILDLSKNNITNITENNFRGQDNLYELDLSRNKIFRMSSSTFRHLTELRRLNLADNSIVDLVQRNFFMLSKLKYLDLSGNPLQDLQPDVFRDLPELKVFKCRNCQLKKINPQLYNLLPQLTELDLGRNEFKFMDKDEFHDVKRLTKVLLDGNQLSVVVDELFRMQKSLQHLDLSYNRLAKVPNDSFQSLGNLTFLDLSYNKLVRLEPQSVRNLGKLRVLNISGNTQMDLHEIRETFELMPQLTHLSVADMGILPMGLLVPFQQLRYLNISGNHLDNMSLQIIDPCRHLEFLDLSRNQLYGINEDTALRIQGIRNVRLDNNPLICDECHMGKLINVVRHLQWKWETYPICFLPKSLRGAEITDLDEGGLDSCLEYITDEEHNAASTSHNFLERGGLSTLAILAGIISVLIVIIVLAMVVCFSKHRARYYTREERLNAAGEGKCLEKNLEASATSTTTVKRKSSDVDCEGGYGQPKALATSPILNNTKSNINTNTNTISNSNDTGNGLASPVAEGSEINFKFPIDERVCSVDELLLTSAPMLREIPPPMTISGIVYNATSGNGGGGTVNATTLAAVAAAATVIPPGAPSATMTVGTTQTQTQTKTRVQTQKPTTQQSHAFTTMPSEAVVVVLPPPPPPPASTIAEVEQRIMQLTSREPLVSVN